MPAQTAADVHNMIEGSDFRASVNVVNSSVAVNGVLIRQYRETLDVNGQDVNLVLTSANAASIAIGAVVDVTLDATTTRYTVRGKEPREESTVLVLEKTG